MKNTVYSFFNIIIYNYNFLKKKIIQFHNEPIIYNSNSRLNIFFILFKIKKVIILYIYNNKHLKYEIFTIKVLLGRVIKFTIEFDKLKAFYKQYLNKISNIRYKIINLQYKNQVIATKR